MKTQSSMLLLALTLTLATQAAVASDITGLTSFTAGTPARAADVNGNFTAVKTAVDDNQAQITALEGVNAETRLSTLETTATGGNIVLAPSTAATGNILKDAVPFLHNFGLNGTSTFLGRNSGNFTMTGTNNTAVGYNTLVNNGSGLDNVAMGLNALANNTSANSNTALGVSAMYATNTGGANVAVGTFALEQNTSGTNNIAIGYAAGQSLIAGSNNILIGHNGTSESLTTRIGTIQTRAFISGIRNVTTTAVDAIPVLISSTGQLGTASSSRRVKDDIADMGEASTTLMKLRPVTFHYKADQNPKGRALQYGLIAEEVEKVAPGLVARSANGEIETVYYQHLTPMLLNEYQKQQRLIEIQTAALTKQTARVAALEKQGQEIVALKQELARMAAVLARLGQPEKVASIGR